MAITNRSISIGVLTGLGRPFEREPRVNDIGDCKTDTAVKMNQTFQNKNTNRGNASRLGTLFALWGLFSFLALIVHAIVRMMPVFADMFAYSMNPIEISSLVASVILFTVGKGYFAFQRSFSPRFGERARMLQENPSVVYGVLAPLYCMGLIGAPLSRMVRMWLMVAIVVVLIISVRTLSDPWRGIVLAGVVVALVWGSIATVISVSRELAVSRQTAVSGRATVSRQVAVSELPLKPGRPNPRI